MKCKKVISKQINLNKDFYTEKEKHIESLIQYVSKIKRMNLDETAMFEIIRNNDSITISLAGMRSGGILALKIKALNQNGKLSFYINSYIEKGALILFISIFMIMIFILLNQGSSISKAIYAQFFLIIFFFLFFYLPNIFIYRYYILSKMEKIFN